MGRGCTTEELVVEMITLRTVPLFCSTDKPNITTKTTLKTRDVPISILVAELLSTWRAVRNASVLALWTLNYVSN